MNKEDLYRAIGGLEEEDLNVRKPRKKFYGWAGGIAAVLVLGLGLSLFPRPAQSMPPVQAAQTPSVRSEAPEAQAAAPAPMLTLLASPSYPDMPSFPEPSNGRPTPGPQLDAWKEGVQNQIREPGYAEGLSPFLENTMEAFLSQTDGKNKLCSPLNIYMALSMLAEISGGESRDQILTALGSTGIESLRTQAAQVWNAHYRNDGINTLLLANSLWLNRDLPLNRKTLDTVAKNYYAASYAGVPGSPEMDQALQAWINEQTGDMLTQQANNAALDPQTILSLVSALQYQAKWAYVFEKELTAPQAFHTPTGDVTVDFLRKDQFSDYFRGDGFGAVPLVLSNGGGTMWLLQPEEGTTPETLLTDPQVYSLLSGHRDWDRKEYTRIHLALPKFDIDSTLDLSSGLQSMGITDVFTEQADFSPLLESAADYNPRLTKCDHAVRVAVDEEGVTAAAFTQMAVCGSGAPPREEIDFILDRPFLFVVTSADDLPILSGIVNNPLS